MIERIELTHRDLRVALERAAELRVFRNGGGLWSSDPTHPPTLHVRRAKRGTINLALSSARTCSVSDFREELHCGQKLRLWNFDNTDVAIELALAFASDTGELMVQVAQVGGNDVVSGVDHLFRFEKSVASGGYLVLPHGSGYLIHADCPDALPGEGLVGGTIGGRWSLPFFGIVRGDEGLMANVQSWWDCDVQAEHRPGESSALDFNWLPSLGTLSYPRRFSLHFEQNLDYVGMAKRYRRRAQQEGLLRTLREKAEQTPQLTEYLRRILVRWPAWNPSQLPEVLRQIQQLRKMGLELTIFFPKWSSSGHAAGHVSPNTCDGLWQAYLLDDPVPGGWSALVEFNDRLRELNCLVQGFLCPVSQNPQAPHFDPQRQAIKPDGTPWEYFLSACDEVERIKAVLQNLERHRLHMDVMYYDGASAHINYPEDFSPHHRCSRRDTYEVQNKSFATTRQEGVMPGAELARFWAMRDCDYWFFTDWSADRLFNTQNQNCPKPVGEPVPLFQLVFHDCYLAGFSGGGYSVYAPGFDWWADRNPRLYELLFVAAPAHNWLPGGAFPYEQIDSHPARQRWDWLRMMSGWCQRTKLSEMTGHTFESGDRKQQRVTFANGVAGEFDMATDRYRLTGIDGIGHEWRTVPKL